jgi:hypothetical protein
MNGTAAMLVLNFALVMVGEDGLVLRAALRIGLANSLDPRVRHLTTCDYIRRLASGNVLLAIYIVTSRGMVADVSAVCEFQRVNVVTQ